MQVALCVALACIVQDASLAISNLVVAALPLVMLFWYWRQVKQVARMMKVAADSIAANPGLLPFAVGTNVAAIAPVFGLGAAVYFMQGNGVARRAA